MNLFKINLVKVEKPSFMKLKNNQNPFKNPNIFRVFEIFLVVAVISRLSLHIQPPLALVFMLSREYVHTISLLLSPPFVFILGNAIVITLIINSPNYHAKRLKHPSRGSQKKPVAGEETIMAAIFPAQAEEQAVMKVYRRSKSESRATREKVQSGELRRVKSNMEIVKSSKGYCCNCGNCSSMKTKVGHYPEDHMSNEEFRKKIEEFIAKQQKYLRQEED